MRKVAKLPSSSVGQENGEEEGHLPSSNLKRKSEERRSPVPEKFNKVDKEVLTEGLEAAAAVDEATQTESRASVVTETESGHNRITLVSKKRIVGQLVVDRKAVHEAVTEVKEESAVNRTAKEKQAEAQKRPWRNNMKNTGTTPSQPSEDMVPVAKKRPEPPAKPWRANMKPPEAKIEATAEVLPKKSVEEKPWRINMKKVEEKPPEVTVKTGKKRHFDRDEVKKYMLEKRKRENARQEEEERQEWKY